MRRKLSGAASPHSALMAHLTISEVRQLRRRTKCRGLSTKQPKIFHFKFVLDRPADIILGLHAAPAAIMEQYRQRFCRASLSRRKNRFNENTAFAIDREPRARPIFGLRADSKPELFTWSGHRGVNSRRAASLVRTYITADDCKCMRNQTILCYFRVEDECRAKQANPRLSRSSILSFCRPAQFYLRITDTRRRGDSMRHGASRLGCCFYSLFIALA